MRNFRVGSRVCLNSYKAWTFKVTKVTPQPNGNTLYDLDAIGLHRRNCVRADKRTTGIDYQSNLREIPRVEKRKVKARKWEFKRYTGRWMLNGKTFVLACKDQTHIVRELNRLENQVASLKNRSAK